MLATYPDVFAGGSIGAGLAYRCAASLTQASTCQYGPVSKTPQQWGTLVRNASDRCGIRGAALALAIVVRLTSVRARNQRRAHDEWTNVPGVADPHRKAPRRRRRHRCGPANGSSC